MWKISKKLQSTFASVILLFLLASLVGGMLTPRVAQAVDPVITIDVTAESKSAAAAIDTLGISGTSMLIDCGIDTVLNGVLVGGMKCTMRGVFYIISQVSRFILWIAAGIFEFVLRVTVLEFQTFANLPAVTEAWTVIRDTGNIFFIFVLLYVGIGTILNLHQVDAEKMITSIVIAALLVNFSATFTRILIDASNLTAVAFYEQATSAGGGDSLSASIVGDLQLSNLTTSGDTFGNPFNGAIDGTITTIASILFAIAFITVTIVLLLIFSIMLTVRAVKFIILIILSPVAYIAPIIPFAEKLSGEWWSVAKSELLFAPALMLMFSIAMKVNHSVAAVSAKSSSPWEHVFNYVLTMGMLIGSLILDKKFSVAGGEWGTKVLKGAAAMAGRNTIGRAAERLRSSEGFKSLTNKIPGGMGRHLDKGLGKVSGASFGGAAGGFMKAREARKEAIKGYADSQGEMDYYRQDDIRQKATATMGKAGADLDAAAGKLGVTRRSRESDADLSTRLSDDAVKAAKDQAKTRKTDLTQGMQRSIVPSTRRAGYEAEPGRGKDSKKLAETFAEEAQQRLGRARIISDALTDPRLTTKDKSDLQEKMSREYQGAKSAWKGVDEDAKDWLRKNIPEATKYNNAVDTLHGLPTSAMGSAPMTPPFTPSNLHA